MSFFDNIGSDVSWLYCQMNIVSPNKEMEAVLTFSARGAKSKTRATHSFCHNNNEKRNLMKVSCDNGRKFKAFDYDDLRPQVF